LILLFQNSVRRRLLFRFFPTREKAMKMAGQLILKKISVLDDRKEDYGMGSIVCSFVCGARVLYKVP
jgi:hypothetical protein